MFTLRAVALAAAIVSVSSVTSLAEAEYAVFGNKGVLIGQSSTVPALVGSNFDIQVFPFSTFGGLEGGGTLFGGGTGGGSGAFTVTGNVLFNGDIVGSSSSEFQGTIYAGNTVDLSFAQSKTGPIVAGGNVFQGQSAHTQGNITAGGSFTNQNFSVVNGNVSVNGSVYVNGTVNGNISYQGIVSVGTFGKINGTTTTAPVVVNVPVFVPVSTPAATTFSSGGANVTSGGTAASPLAPGSYGALTISTFNDLYLTAGDYYFNSFNFDGDEIHLLNVGPNSKIRVFITGDFYADTFTEFTVNGASFEDASPDLARHVLFETHGKFSTGGSLELFGTVFAPTGDIALGSFNTMKGSLFTGGQLTTGVRFDLQVPEPSSLGVLALGGVLMIRRRRP